MADRIATTQDPRRRNLSIMAGIAIVMVVLAVLALIRQSQQVAPHYQPEAFLPGLASKVRDVAHIRIVSKSNTVDVQFKPDKGWVETSHNDYPASFEHVRETVVGLAALETIEPKTARADWLHFLDLDAPPKGDGIEITLQDGQGHTLASIVTGKTVEIGDASGAVGLFVRQTDSDQSWLVRSVYQPKADAREWLDKQLVDVDMSRIQEVDVNPADGPSYEFRRDKPNVAGLNLVDIPKGREIAYSGITDSVAGAISGLTLEDVQPAKNFDFSDAGHVSRLVTHTFDGLTVTVNCIQKGNDYWATVSAEGAADKPNAQKQARAIDGRSSGWAYKLPSYKGRQFMTTLESLLKPLPAAPAAPATPGK
ncbi:MAG TPA: DUF4340 domain-containing protein [Rhizomicrobium sp.]|jgi:hypothetical protein|nr:DUF4340 domain-containing protein [Rhizomicrobium sp.]